MTRNLLLALSLASFFLPGCMPTARNVAGSPSAGAEAQEPPMDYLTALALVKNWELVNFGGFSSDLLTGRRMTSDETGVTLTTNEGTFRCRYKDTPNPFVSMRPLAFRPTRVAFNCGRELLVWDSADKSKVLVRAWKTMVAGVPVESAQEAAVFAALVDSYRTDPAAFVMSEETRAFKVQAETAVREKRTWDAALRFNDALKLSPWWAQGRFNLALIYGEMQLYTLASAQMGKYLKLAPDAPNARAAQDKIYEWRDKAAR